MLRDTFTIVGVYTSYTFIRRANTVSRKSFPKKDKNVIVSLVNTDIDGHTKIDIHTEHRRHIHIARSVVSF